jgi:hypothetical protein
MNRRRFIAYFLALSILIGAVQVVAVRFSLYFELPWLDTVMHFLGGVWIASITLVILTFLRKGELPSSRAFLLATLSVIAGVAILWEILELVVGLNQIPRNEYWPDTIGDVVTGTIGACAGWFALSRKYLTH